MISQIRTTALKNNGDALKTSQTIAQPSKFNNNDTKKEKKNYRISIWEQAHRRNEEKPRISPEDRFSLVNGRPRKSKFHLPRNFFQDFTRLPDKEGCTDLLVNCSC